MMIANSTGIAPFRAFWQHRLHSTLNSLPPQKSILFFGCRRREEDYIFEEEIEEVVSQEHLTAVFEAFSRMDDIKVYVQDILATKKDMLNRCLFVNNGVLYLCGSNSMIEDVLSVLKSLLEEIFPNVDSQTKLDELKENKQVVFEGWG